MSACYADPSIVHPSRVYVRVGSKSSAFATLRPQDARCLARNLLTAARWIEKERKRAYRARRREVASPMVHDDGIQGYWRA